MNCTFLSFGVPAKPGIAKDFIEADDIVRKAFADFIDSLLVKKSVFHNPHKMLQAYKVLKLARSNKKKLFLVSMTFFLLHIMLNLS